MALLSALIISVVLVIVAAGVVTYTTGSSRRAEQEHARREALNVAESGAEWAIATLDPASLASASAQNVRFNDGTYTVRTRALGSERYAVQATGSVGSGPFAATRRIEVVLRETRHPMGDFAVASGGNLTVNGNVAVSSSPVTGQGNMHSNSAVILNGGAASIAGRVSAVGSVTPTTHSGVSGAITQGSQPLEIPTYSPAKLLGLRNEAAGNGSQSIAGFSGSTLAGHLTGPGNLSLTGNITLTGPVIYVDGNLSITGNTTVTATSNTLFIVTGTVSISGNPTVTGPSGGGLGIVSLAGGTAISLGGANNLRAHLFAPNGAIDVHGNVRVTGSLIAGGAGALKGHVSVTRDTTSPADILRQKVMTTQSWRAVPN